jgi:hypothetical protein
MSRAAGGFPEGTKFKLSLIHLPKIREAIAR